MELNPCMPCIRKYGICDINNVNTCCYNVVAGYSQNGFPTSGISCEQCIKQSIDANDKKYYWRSFKKPIIYNNIPHYFPQYLKQTGNKQQSLELCKKQCETSFYHNECVDYCNLDAQALVKY